MQTRAVVEISADMDPQTQARLVSSAYRWSRSGLVVLALHGITPRSVDRILNPVVADVGLNVCGVMYVDAADTETLRRCISPSTLVIPSTDGFRSRVDQDATITVDLEEAERRLRDTAVPWSALDRADRLTRPEALSA